MKAVFPSSPLTFQKTRFAPTPSGFLHLGNVYSFLLTYHFAKKFGTKILLRIDDLDRERVRKEYIQDIFDTLDFLELNYDEGPRNYIDFQNNYSQQHRVTLYQKSLDILLHSNALFACDCSRSKIKKKNPYGHYKGYCRDKGLPMNFKNCAWRIKLDKNENIEINDIFKGKLREKIPDDMLDLIIKRKDNLPSYQLASIVDDIHFGIDLIVRGLDLWNSSLAQIFISKQIKNNSFSQTVFYHHPLIMGHNNLKLSKSSGSTSIQYLRKIGKRKTDIFQIIGDHLQSEIPLRSLEEIMAFLRTKESLVPLRP